MARIAQLYFPLVTIALAHVSRLNSGHAPYISPMLGAAASMHPQEEGKTDAYHTDSLPRSLPGSESNKRQSLKTLLLSAGLPTTLERGADPVVMSSMKSLTSLELAAAMGHRSTPRSAASLSLSGCHLSICG